MRKGGNSERARFNVKHAHAGFRRQPLQRSPKAIPPRSMLALTTSTDMHVPLIGSIPARPKMGLIMSILYTEEVKAQWQLYLSVFVSRVLQNILQSLKQESVWREQGRELSVRRCTTESALRTVCGRCFFHTLYLYHFLLTYAWD